MKLLIVGRTGSGKDYFAGLLAREYGYKFVKSYATRPKRTEDEDSHIFITQETAGQIPESDKVAKTVINGYEYFATRQQVEEADGYIIDPKGLYELARNMPEQPFEILYIRAKDEVQRKFMTVGRAADKQNESKVYEKRCASEDAQFTQFEDITGEHGGLPGFNNCGPVIVFENDYTKESAKRYAEFLHLRRILFGKLQPMLDKLILEHYIVKLPNGNIKLPSKDSTDTLISREVLAQYLLDDDEGLATLVRNYLACDNAGFLPPESMEEP